MSKEDLQILTNKGIAYIGDVRLYFVKKGNLYLWKDGEYYEGFLKTAYAVSEEQGNCLVDIDRTIELEYVDPIKFKGLYWEYLRGYHEEPECDCAKESSVLEETKEARRTYVKASGFAIAPTLDRLYSEDAVSELWISIEDGEFLISFEYARSHERKGRKGTCSGEVNAKI